ncbi:hypothetical protein FHX37_0500 [Haloactinospora alba]|uniref:Uncharacterized protein n=1 Tax=Haloactinospora alba TaxID=405555 RepID=A0A543NFK9_9ACTN|nr:hypothetical protein [Haloactinospora alba]TQN30618.1 hypothetical protein FHX37_0500 [Haloactinospora alba]
MTSKQNATITNIDYDKPPEDAAEAAEAEAEDRRHVLQVPTGDGENLELVLPKRWKRFKFMRRMSSGDLWGAIEAIGFAEEQLDRLEEADISEEEFEQAVRTLGESLTGKSEGKSSNSKD